MRIKVMIILSLLLFTISYVTKKEQTVFIEKIDLNLKEEEVAITFFPVQDSKALLFTKGRNHLLFLLETMDEEQLEAHLKTFGAKRVELLLLENDFPNSISAQEKYLFTDEIEWRGIEFEKENEYIKVSYQNHTFCIDESDVEEIDCNYLYLVNENQKLRLSKKTKLVIYDETIGRDYKEKLYNEWVDTDTLDQNSFFILKLEEENYEIILVPYKEE